MFIWGYLCEEKLILIAEMPTSIMYRLKGYCLFLTLNYEQGTGLTRDVTKISICKTE